MVYRYGKWVFIVMVCLGLAIAGCAPAKKPGVPIGLTAQYDEAKRLFQQATEMGGKDCAPVEYAEAQVQMDHADHEWGEAQYDEAAQSIAIVKQKSIEAIEKCRPKPEVAPPAPPPPEKPEVVEKPPTFTFAPVYFDAGKADIRSDAMVILDRVGAALNEYPVLKVEVAGHSDSGGSEEANMELSMKRARSVAIYLEDRFGISPHRIKAVGYGESRPVADNSTVEGRRMNRRVEFRTFED
ncbi:MAG: OmpA family protein [Proteobacteria bacterium]|nr:OmpA family protein [Pseudomonadota bacterium]NIS70880.1 OmpA family protein [Pseudomonadota bacterium]